MSSDDCDRTKIITVEALFGAMMAFLGVAALISILLVYSIYCLRRRQRNLTTSNGVAPLPTALNSAEPPRTGLDQSTIALIPKFVYKASHHPHRLSQGEDGIECSVCLSTIVEEAIVRLLPNCKHLFHEDCIDVWLRSHMTCPVCRAMVDPRPQAEIDELGGAAVQPTAPPQEESTADGLGGSASRLSSFRRMLSRERSSRRIQSCGDEEAGGGAEDIERH